MKKLFSLLLAATLLLSLVLPAGAASTTGYVLSGAKAITLKASGSGLAPLRLTDQKTLDAFHAMIAAAGERVSKPRDAVEVMRVTAERNGKDYSYILQRSDEKYYLVRGTACREMDLDSFSKLLKTAAAMDGFYQYIRTNNGRVQFTATGDDTHLGEVTVLRITGITNADPLATWTSDISFTRPPQFFRQADGSQLMLFPVSYVNSVGQHWVEVTCAGETARYVINAKNKTWQRQDLTVDSTTTAETIESQQANTEFENAISPIRGIADDKAHWSGRFILPCSDDKVTTQFGMVRYVNGQATSVRHGAIDLAVPRGTTVKATGAGRVLYSGYLQLTGNTVVIEHGYGLKSWYYHMDSRNVQTGDMVTQAQQIGTVGSTGFSTGPHLHFGMSINNVFINPYTAINTDLLADVGK